MTWVAIREQKRSSDPQRYRQPLYVVDRNVTHLPLNMSDERPMKTRLMSKLLLRPSALGAQTL